MNLLNLTIKCISSIVRGIKPHVLPILYVSCLLFLLISSLCAAFSRHEFSENIVYYLETPKNCTHYPLILAIEGSYDHEIGPQSVLRLHTKLNPLLVQTGFGLITMERRGVDQNQINTTLFHQYNTPSQRLSDHTLLVDHLRKNPPKNWNGQLVIFGGSEGGSIAIKLSHSVKPSACVVLVGCGDQPFKEYIWNIFNHTTLKIVMTTKHRFTL